VTVPASTDNELFVVTVATWPVAVYRILGKAETIVNRRGHPTAQLYRPAPQPRAPQHVHDLSQDTPGHMRLLARQITYSRITVDSGAPIGYLKLGARP
jgi:hypothetical protein